MGEQLPTGCCYYEYIRGTRGAARIAKITLAQVDDRQVRWTRIDVILVHRWASSRYPASQHSMPSSPAVLLDSSEDRSLNISIPSFDLDPQETNSFERRREPLSRQLNVLDFELVMKLLN
jgi:hypothetical protein